MPIGESSCAALAARFSSIVPDDTSACVSSGGIVNAAEIVSRSRKQKMPYDTIGTGSGFAPPAPNIRANAASLATPLPMFTAVTVMSFTAPCTMPALSESTSSARSQIASIEFAVA